MIKLDDFLTKKKEPAQVLDLSKVKITSKDEFKKYLDKIPECKVKPEKILPEHVRIRDKEFSFLSGKKEEKHTKEWNYPDPTPPDMKGAKLEDLCPINIDWKMLTTLRPKTKVEEDMFSRLVQLGKLDLKYQSSLKKEKITDWVRKTKNPKSSIIEMRVLSCKECGEDFCDGSMCSKLMYENFFRPQPVVVGPSQSLLLAAETGEPKKKKKKKRKKRKRKARKRNSSKGKKKLGKNSIFNRPASRGCSRDHSRKTVDSGKKIKPRALSSTRSFSPQRMRAGFFEKRSKSAPRIHFECDILGSKTTRYEFTSDSAPSQTDYSSQSDSESPDFDRRFIVSRLRLSGRRKLLSARVNLDKKKQRESFSEESRYKFVRRCTLYKNYHSDPSYTNSNEEEFSSGSSTPVEPLSKSPEPKIHQPSSAKCPATIQIRFDESMSNTGVIFPEKMILPTRSLPKKKDSWHFNKKGLKEAENFAKAELGLGKNFHANEELLLRTHTGFSRHISRPKIPSRLSKFSGPYLKAKGLFPRNTD